MGRQLELLLDSICFFIFHYADLLKSFSTHSVIQEILQLIFFLGCVDIIIKILKSIYGTLF